MTQFIKGVVTAFTGKSLIIYSKDGTVEIFIGKKMSKLNTNKSFVGLMICADVVKTENRINALEISIIR